MKDFDGVELSEGDTVAVTVKGYRELVKAKVVGFTPQKVKLEYNVHGRTFPEKYLVLPNFVVKLRGDV